MSSAHSGIQPISSAYSAQYTAQARALALHLAIAGAHVTPVQLQLWAIEGLPALEAYMSAALCHQLSAALKQRAADFIATYDALMADLTATIAAQENQEDYEAAL